jgi:hypothetical protein
VEGMVDRNQGYRVFIAGSYAVGGESSFLFTMSTEHFPRMHREIPLMELGVVEPLLSSW